MNSKSATEMSTKELMAHFGLEGNGPRSVFLQLHESILGRGALPAGTKELIALAVCITGHREDALEDHVERAKSSGASKEAILEVIGEAILMGGHAALPFGFEAAKTLKGI